MEIHLIRRALERFEGGYGRFPDLSNAEDMEAMEREIRRDTAGLIGGAVSAALDAAGWHSIREYADGLGDEEKN